MERVMKSFLLVAAVLAVIGGAVTCTVLSAPAAHAEPCGGRGYSQNSDSSGNSP
ncbi:hypothetical protein [Burkholderia sp. PU8-34]